MSSEHVQIIGGGLAGCEAAWQLAERGFAVDLYEMRPLNATPAHKTDRLAELVCSNSLRSASTLNAVGILKREMHRLGSLVIEAALACRVPAGDALAVDRERFSLYIHEKIHGHDQISVARREIDDLAPLLQRGPVIIATGPLTSLALTEALKPYIHQDQLYFYDAIAPIVDGATIDREKVFAASRYDKGGGADYLNCPMNETEYYDFVRQVRNGQRVVLKSFEEEKYFEGCLPIEVMADRGDLTLAFGPMKPVGLTDPRTGRQPFAAVQLRAEDCEGVAYNLVGFQTKLTYPEQKRIFAMIPGLEKAEFFRLGSIHRNTYINSTLLLDAQFRLKREPRLRFAGQITGTEGYVESSAVGLLVALLLAAELNGERLDLPPRSTSLGAMAHYLTDEPRPEFQPMNINFGLFETPPAAGGRKPKKADRKVLLSERAAETFERWAGGVSHAKPLTAIFTDTAQTGTLTV